MSRVRNSRVASACVAENTSPQLCDRVKARDASTEREDRLVWRYGWRTRSRWCCRHLCRDSLESLGSLAWTRAQCDFTMWYIGEVQQILHSFPHNRIFGSFLSRSLIWNQISWPIFRHSILNVRKLQFSRFYSEEKFVIHLFLQNLNQLFNYLSKVILCVSH